MNLLILGSGGREHALAWKLAQSKKVDRLFIAPGNAGTSALGANLNIDPGNFSDVKKTFNSVDSVGNSRFVFNVKGNHYRIVALLLFQIKRVYIRWVGTHKDYDKIKNIDKI